MERVRRLLYNILSQISCTVSVSATNYEEPSPLLRRVMLSYTYLSEREYGVLSTGFINKLFMLLKPQRFLFSHSSVSFCLSLSLGELDWGSLVCQRIRLVLLFSMLFVCLFWSVSALVQSAMNQRM